MEQHFPESLKGQLLIAMPGLNDPNFFQTVTVICEHTPEGAVGLVVNRIHSGLSAKDIFNELDIACGPDADGIQIHNGGPVHEDEIFVLHGPPFNWQGSLTVSPHLAISNTLDVLSAVATGKGPESFMIALGCAGWGGGQLEYEIKENAWLTAEASQDLIFRLPLEDRWEVALRRMGIDPDALSQTAGHA